MPFLRFTRDKRGYEHTYLLHASARKGGAARLLYWYRTPPGVKVGRPAFDESVRHALEAQHPGITFDWPKLMSTPLPSPDVEHWRERRRLEKAARQARQAAERDRLGPSEPPEDPARVPGIPGVSVLDDETDESQQDETVGQVEGFATEASVPSRPVQDEAHEPFASGLAAKQPEAAVGWDSPPDRLSPTAQSGSTNPSAPSDAAGRTRRRRRRGGRRRRRELPSGAPGMVTSAPSSNGSDREGDDGGDKGSTDGSDSPD